MHKHLFAAPCAVIPESEPGTARPGFWALFSRATPTRSIISPRLFSLASGPSVTMGGAENGGAATGEKEVKKQDSHTEHRDDFVASVGLSSAGWLLQGARLKGAASLVVPLSSALPTGFCTPGCGSCSVQAAEVR